MEELIERVAMARRVIADGESSNPKVPERCIARWRDYLHSVELVIHRITQQQGSLRSTHPVRR